MTSGWIAYVDESMRVGAGAYVLAAACLEVVECEDARRTVAGLAKPGQRFHWRQSSVPMQHKAVGVVAGLPALHLVVVAAPLDPRRQERGRRQCLRRLLFELENSGVGRVVMEAREQRLNARDIQAVDAFRAAGLIGPDIVVEHAYPAGPAGEPLLWVPDIVAGAIGGELDRGDPLAGQLSSVVTRYYIELN
ncbi:hypothetical protein [Planosporangium mesophilum]|uniref:DUF3800 domain-containing protein n=1 Tax=Planosporangium mesophilum TaxID=689768 RepID=A0A8J3T8T4_9ACTN|nr:hypothetical protein [Planosporangium mesophilum]NJC81598.1 hypothetical protein [Planosporangium mesophilum]GII20742.1 hypothetical protein Pme01_03390 [Planosporangium mesophilum]